MDKPQAIAILSRRLAPRVLEELTWAQFTQSIGALPDNTKADLLNLVRSGRAQELATAVIGAVRVKVRELAAVEAADLLADDSLSLEELDRLL